MSETNNFMNMFGGRQAEPELASNMIQADAPNALTSFMNLFDKPMESFFFYNDTIELRFDKEAHKYYRVQELGDLKEQRGVTTVCHIIDRSAALTPWAAKKVAEKLLRIIPIEKDDNGADVIPKMSLLLFTDLVMQAKLAPQEEKETAGDVGHMAHQCLEDSIRWALENTQDHIVRELKEIPTDGRAETAARSAKVWMDAHNVRWLETESKIYSKEHEYAGTMDGLAVVDSCNDRSCCRADFKDHLSLIDWKSSNYLYIEFLFQTASYQHAKQEETGLKIVDRWVLRLGKDEDEAGKFEPWYMGPEDFASDLAGFLACLRLVNLVEEVKQRMSTQKKDIRAVKKEVKREAKVVAKAIAKAEKAKAKEEKRVEREKEKQRIKEESRAERDKLKWEIKEAARKAREEKRVTIPSVPSSNSSSGVGNSQTSRMVDPVVEKFKVKLFEIPSE